MLCVFSYFPLFFREEEKEKDIQSLTSVGDSFWIQNNMMENSGVLQNRIFVLLLNYAVFLRFGHMKLIN